MFAPKIKYLFPAKSSNVGIEERIIKYLGKENLEFGLEFCTSILKREDCDKIREGIGNINNDIIIDYHEMVINKSKTEKDTTKLIAFITALSELKIKANKVTARACCLSQVGDCDTSQKAEQFLQEYELVKEMIINDEPFLTSIYEQYDREISSLQVSSDSDLVTAYNHEKSLIKSHALSQLNNRINGINRKKAWLENLIIYDYSKNLGKKIMAKERKFEYGRYHSSK
mgnify:CR=1 FL=1